MKQRSIIFLQVVVVLIGIGALVFLLWEPHIEGRNINSTVWEIYFNDPFLAFAYFASIPFFVGIYNCFKLLGFFGKDKTFSNESLKSLRIIKLCAIATIFFVFIGEIFILANRENEDPSGGVFIGLLIVTASIIITFLSKKFEKIILRKLA
ncbi:MAG TPA: DUF2975 domain-containing protein [Bacteroidetes bacterium]|nr:DUF2975 domain-containing protein [Bacteroidota bacterium]HCN36897.1 DUF2975 domain-containing protein [Bacteroidota bacterium]